MSINFCVRCVVFSRAKLYPDTTVSYTDVDDVNVVPSACQWQGCKVATDRLRLAELSVFVETDRLMSEQVLILSLNAILSQVKSSQVAFNVVVTLALSYNCLLYTSPSPRD